MTNGGRSRRDRHGPDGNHRDTQQQQKSSVSCRGSVHPRTVRVLVLVADALAPPRWTSRQSRIHREHGGHLPQLRPRGRGASPAVCSCARIVPMVHLRHCGQRRVRRGPDRVGHGLPPRPRDPPQSAHRTVGEGVDLEQTPGVLQRILGYEFYESDPCSATFSNSASSRNVHADRWCRSAARRKDDHRSRPAASPQPRSYQS
jgi:hypothetical protein